MVTIAWMLQDDYDGLAAPLAEFRSLSERLGNRFFIAWYHTTIGWVEGYRGNFARGRQGLLTALEYDAELGGAATAGFATAFLGHIEALTGDFDRAQTRLEGFLPRAAATGDSLGLPFALPALARLLVGRGVPAEARPLIEPLIEGLRELGVPWLMSGALSVLGMALLAQGDLDAAQQAHEEARTVGSSIDNPRLMADADYHLGRLARERGDLVRAEDLHHTALAARVRGRMLPGIVESLEAIAALAADHESHDEAVRLFGAAATVRSTIGLARWPADQADHDGELARLRQALGEAGLDRGWAEGAVLGVDDAVAYASRARGERKRPSSGWASLTPTELDVVKLAAKGLTNPEIGERLFSSRGTVKTHLAHVFAKMGVATRAELAAEATRRELR